MVAAVSGSHPQAWRSHPPSLERVEVESTLPKARGLRVGEDVGAEKEEQSVSITSNILWKLSGCSLVRWIDTCLPLPGSEQVIVTRQISHILRKVVAVFRFTESSLLASS